VHWIVYLPGVRLLRLALAAFIGSYAAQQAMELWSKVGDGVDQEGGISWG